MPEISIILPPYNRAKTLPRAVQSILSQTFTNFELIIVDDGSNDNTTEVVRGFKDNRIKYIKIKENKGASAARNIGIKSAKGKYIAFQDSDDEWLPEKLRKQIDIFRKVSSKIGMIYTDMWEIVTKRKKYFYSPHIMPIDGIIYKKALRYFIKNIGLATAVIKKECFDKIGLFDEELPRYIDLELFIRISKIYQFYHITEPLIKYYKTPRNISSSFENLIKARKLILQKYSDSIKKDRKLLAYHFYKLGNLLFSNNIKKRCKNSLFQAFKNDPLSLRIWLFLLLSLFGPKTYKKVIESKFGIKLEEATIFK